MTTSIPLHIHTLPFSTNVYEVLLCKEIFFSENPFEDFLSYPPATQKLF